MRGCWWGGACVVACWGVCVVADGGCVWLLAGMACVVAAWGVCMVAGRGACMVAGGCAWLPRGGLRRIRRDTVNERAVRILLECILVFIMCYFISLFVSVCSGLPRKDIVCGYTSLQV